MPGPDRTPPPVPTQRRPFGAAPIRVPQLTRVDLPSPDGAVVLDGDTVLVLVDPRVSDAQVDRLMQAAQLLAELPAQQPRNKDDR